MKDIKYCLYWYKLPFYTDPFTQGYIGVTNNMKRRDLEHRRNKKVTHFTNALAKYPDIAYAVLAELNSPELALALEYEYRPSINIGWNSAIGGEDTLQSIRTTPIMLYHKDSYPILHVFASITEAASCTGLTAGRLTQARHRNTATYGSDGWAILWDINHDRSTTKTTTETRSNATTGIKRGIPSHFKGVKRWSDEDKARISQQHKGKTKSESQKKAVSIKNKQNSTLCRAIKLVHKSSLNHIHTFHSISEASRVLGIPLSRLKSKAQRPINRYGSDGWAITYLGPK